MADDNPTMAAGAGTMSLGGDLPVNRMGFGAMRVTGQGIWGDPPNRDEAIAVLRRVVELGVDFIDTADSYGPEVSEALLAEALTPYPDGMVIATKGGLVRPGPGQWVAGRPIPTTCGRPARAACAACGWSRSRCTSSTGRIRRSPLEESVGALVELQQQGKIRHIGLSNVSVKQLRRRQAADADRVRAESLQPHRPRLGVDGRSCVPRSRSPSCRGRRFRISMGADRRRDRGTS